MHSPKRPPSNALPVLLAVTATIAALTAIVAAMAGDLVYCLGMCAIFVILVVAYAVVDYR